MREKVPIMPPAHVRDLSLDNVGSNNHRREDANNTVALPVIPDIRVTSTGSQQGALDAASWRNGSHGSNRAELPDRANF